MVSSSTAAIAWARIRSSAASRPSSPSSIDQVMSIVVLLSALWGLRRSRSSSKSVRIGCFELDVIDDLRLVAEQVPLRADVGAQAHHALLADRVDRRVGDLGEALLEVAEERGAMVGEDRQREVVAHRAGRLAAVAEQRREQGPQVLLRVAERELALQQRLDRLDRRHRIGQLADAELALRVPLAVRRGAGDGQLGLAVGADEAGRRGRR